MSAPFSIQHHLLEPCKFLASPNFNDRPNPADISLLVIHNISLPPGDFETHDVEDFFLNKLDYDRHPYFDHLRDVKVSSHLFIRRDGEVIQFVPFDKRAWHAGASSFDGVPNCNDYSIGIEMEGADDENFTPAQYEKLIDVTRCLMREYPSITIDRITGHSDIAPSRKTDPGPCFDWERYKKHL